MNKNRSKSNSALKLGLKRRYFIESSRFLPHLAKTHPCSQRHGHSFAIELAFRGPLDPQLGWVMDYSEIDSRVQKTLQLIDHRPLNEVKGLENPTTENLCIWIFSQVAKDFSEKVVLERISIRETRDSECSYP